MIKFFVSSTFVDMDYERDLLHYYVVPELNEYCKKYGEQVEVCDLRWGIDTTGYDEIERSKKILTVCFDEIKNCKPYIIAFIGDRYGWIPDKEYLDEKILQDGMIGKSITELEIQYGALMNNNKDALFYFRELDGNPPDIYKVDNECELKKLNDLKENIKKNGKGRVTKYKVTWKENKLRGISQLKQKIVEDLKNVINRKLEIYNRLSEFEKIQRQNWGFAKYKYLQYSSRPEIENQVLNSISNGTNILGINGRSGSGKSTLLSYFVYELGKRNSIVLPIFCGNTYESLSISSIVKYINEFFYRNYGYGEDVFRKSKGYNSVELLNDFILKYSAEQEKKLFIVIDAVDQMYLENLSLLNRINTASSKVILILSYTSYVSIQRPIEEILIGEIDEKQKAQILTGIVEKKDNKISGNVFAAIMKKKEIDTPLQLGLLYNYLTMFDYTDYEEIRRLQRIKKSIDAINEYQISMIEKVGSNIVSYYIERVARKINYELVMSIMRYIAFSEGGLRERDLKFIINNNGRYNWKPLDFSRLKKLFSEDLIERDDGRYDFAHNYFKKFIRNKYEDKESIIFELVQYMSKLPFDDELRVNEEIYLASEIGDIDSIVEFLDKIVQAQYVNDKKSQVTKELKKRIMHQVYYGENSKDGNVLNLVTTKKIANKNGYLDDYLNLFMDGLIEDIFQCDLDINILLKNMNSLVMNVYYDFELNRETYFLRRKFFLIDLATSYFTGNEQAIRQEGRDVVVRALYNASALCTIKSRELHDKWQGAFYGELALALINKYGNIFKWEKQSWFIEICVNLSKIYEEVGEYTRAKEYIIQEIECCFEILRKQGNERIEIVHFLYLGYVSLAKIMISTVINKKYSYIEKLLNRAIDIHLKYLDKYSDLDEVYTTMELLLLKENRILDARAYVLKLVYYCEVKQIESPNIFNNKRLYYSYIRLRDLDIRLELNNYEEIKNLNKKINILEIWMKERRIDFGKYKNKI